MAALKAGTGLWGASDQRAALAGDRSLADDYPLRAPLRSHPGAPAAPRPRGQLGNAQRQPRQARSRQPTTTPHGAAAVRILEGPYKGRRMDWAEGHPPWTLVDVSWTSQPTALTGRSHPKQRSSRTNQQSPLSDSNRRPLPYHNPEGDFRRYAFAYLCCKCLVSCSAVQRSAEASMRSAASKKFP